MVWFGDGVRCGFQFIETIVKKGLVEFGQGFVLRSSGVLVVQVDRNVVAGLDLGSVCMFFPNNTIKSGLRYVCR